ncbi:MAG TPA: right-handed parallel beta-helix repeat-containing protein, partial [Humisphaera sp.]
MALPYPAASRPFVAPSRVASAAPSARPVVAEPLEPRELMSVSINAAGLTVVTPSADSRVVYVSASGSDLNNGLSASSPVKSLAKAQSLVRDRMPDQVLLKRGDVFYDAFGYWKKSGRGDDEPMVIGAYGDGDRPEVRTGNATGITVGSIAAQRMADVAILGIRFRASGRDPSLGGTAFASTAKGISVVSAVDDLLIEDCKVERFQTNVSFVPVYGDSSDVRVRRCIVVDAFTTSGYGSGLFADGVRGLTVEGSTFDHNGWLEAAGAAANLHNHNLYITGNTSGVAVRYNVIANASSHGVQARSGGEITNNLFVDNPIGLSYGLVNGAGVDTPGGVTGTVSGNVFLGGRDIDGAGRGMAIEVSNIAHASIRDNVISTGYAAGKLWAISLAGAEGVDQGNSVGIQDLTVEDNTIYRWYKGLFLQYGLSPDAGNSWQELGTVTVRNNDWVDIASTVYINTASGYIDINDAPETSAAALRSLGAPDPDRSVASYAETVGLDRSTSSFLREARNRKGGTVDFRFTAGRVIE